MVSFTLGSSYHTDVHSCAQHDNWQVGSACKWAERVFDSALLLQQHSYWDTLSSFMNSGKTFRHTVYSEISIVWACQAEKFDRTKPQTWTLFCCVCSSISTLINWWWHANTTCGCVFTATAITIMLWHEFYFSVCMLGTAMGIYKYTHNFT